MKGFKKLVLIIIVVFTIITLINFNKKTVNTIAIQDKSVKVAVFLLNFTDDFVALIRQNLEDIQKQNQGQVEYTFYAS